MFLGIAGSKLGQEERLRFALNTFSLARLGQLGLTLLIFSGLYLMTPFWKVIPSLPLLTSITIIVLAVLIFR